MSVQSEATTNPTAVATYQTLNQAIFIRTYNKRIAGTYFYANPVL